MKNKKSTIGLMLLMAGSLVLTNCTKDKTNPQPEPDKDMTTTTEAVNTQMIVNDIQELCGQVCESNAFLLNDHDATPVTIMQGTNTINSSNALVNVGSTSYTLTFNNTVGRDGRVRNGVLVFDYTATPASVPNKYYRIPGFIVDVTSVGYSVDNYTIGINNMRISNTTPIGFPGTAPYFPSATNMSWKQTANVSVMSTDGTNTLTTTFNGTINKTLLNTNNTSIPMPPGPSATTYTVFGYSGVNNNFLKLNLQYTSYSIEGTGTLANGSAYTLATNSPLTRNFVSSPELFVVVGNNLITVQRHPFLTGEVSFKPTGKSDRIINFGDAGTVVDYNTKVTIDGITYSHDIR